MTSSSLDYLIIANKLQTSLNTQIEIISTLTENNFWNIFITLLILKSGFLHVGGAYTKYLSEIYLHQILWKNVFILNENTKNDYVT